MKQDRNVKPIPPTSKSIKIPTILRNCDFFSSSDK